MKKCNGCKIEFDGSRENCPFCNNPLSGDPSEFNWPPMDKIKSRALLYKLQLFIAMVCIAVSLALDFLLDLNRGFHYSLIILGWVVTIELLVKYFTSHHVFAAKVVTFSVVIGCFLFTLTALYINQYVPGFFHPVFFIAVPSVVGATIIANFFLAFFDKRGNSLVYLLCTIVLGIIPYIVLKIVLKELLLTWVICVMISVVAALGIVVFKGKAVKSEFQKRFNI